MSSQDEYLDLSNKSGKTETIECSEMANKISKNLQALHETREFFDLILIGSDGIQIRTHRIILCTSTEYFSETIHNMAKTKKILEIEVKEFESGTLESVLQFMYTGSVDFCLETIHQVLKAATHFKMQPLMDLCFNFMEKELNSSNCLTTAIFAKENDYMQLYEEAFTFACNHFEEICSGNDFLDLDEKMVDDILSSDKLVVSSEHKIVQCLLMWLEHDWNNREQNWERRLLTVRYQFLTHNFILENTIGLCINLDCHKLIHLWLEWHVLPKKRSRLLTIGVKSRKGYITPKLNLVTGWKLKDLKVQTYYPEFNTWTYQVIEHSWDNIHSFSAIVRKGVVIIAGGAKRDYTLTNEIKCFHIETEAKWLLPPMKRSRAATEIAILNGYLYVVGGTCINDEIISQTKSVERYNFSEKKWEDVAPLLEPNYNGKIAVLNDCLYLVNSKMQCYHSKDDIWLYRAPKKHTCNHFSLVSSGGYLFTVGGCLQSGQYTNVIERYNPLSDTWDASTTLSSPRNQSKCLAFKNSFFVVGGTYQFEWIDTVEEYNTETNEWKTLAPLLIKSLTIMYSVI